MLQLLNSKGEVNRWTLAGGQPACLEAPLPAHHPQAALAMARSMAVNELDAQARNYSQALAARMPDNGEPAILPMLDENGEPLFDANGQPLEQPNPQWAPQPSIIDGEANAAWTRYDAAQIIVSNVSGEVLNLLSWREGGPGEASVISWIEARAQTLLPQVQLPVPDMIALWQARAALASVNLLDAANAAVAASGPVVATAWEYGNTISRNSPTIAALGGALGLSSADLDNLFRQAAAISL